MKTTPAKIYFVCILVLVCIWIGGGYIHHAAMMRAAQYNAYLNLQQAYQHFIKDGVISNPSPGADIFPYTNTFLIQGTNYNCVLGMHWAPFSGDGSFMAITEEGVAIWSDTNGSPRIVTY
jgi:hypothetical protein